MSVISEFYTLIDQLYASEILLKNQHTWRRSYDGVVLHDKETHTLEFIANNEGISQIQLSKLMHCTKSATSLMVDKLIEKDLVIRERAAEDRRLYTLTLTPKGRRVNEEHQAIDLAFAKTLAENIDVDEAAIAQTNAVLRKISEFYFSKYGEK